MLVIWSIVHEMFFYAPNRHRHMHNAKDIAKACNYGILCGISTRPGTDNSGSYSYILWPGHSYYKVSDADWS